MENKKCSKCGKQKSVKEFNWKYKDKGIRHPNCSECTKKVTKAHYENNKDKYKQRAVKFTRAARKAHCTKIVEYLKENPCVDCGEKDVIVLQFDHVRGKKRDFVSKMVSGAYAWKTIENEIAKCEVRCANCHMRKTAKQFNWKFKGV